MLQHKELTAFASLILLYSRMTDEDRRALISFAEASVSACPRPNSLTIKAVSGRRLFLRRLSHSQNLSLADIRGLIK